MAHSLHILLTNDDGYPAEGLRLLYASLSRNHRVTVVAPEKEQSGAAHAFTYKRTLGCRPLPAAEGMHGFAVSGTPSDCVKLALAHLLETRPDVIVSGINVGENTGMAGHYSGTLAAAREGAFWEVTSAAFSVAEEGARYMADYARTAAAIVEKLAAMHADGFANERRRVFFNVNFPSSAPAESRGIRITRQSLAFFVDKYRLVRDGPAGRVLQLYGAKQEAEPSDAYDSRALDSGYITITPLHFDATAGHVLTHMAPLENSRWYLSGKR
ncbi:MAG: 5'/3'-nucleotidase SurE [Chitinivibrionales bacterium]|nr:5'/3'-nucleotidase SurE [Chitinivibrionales bacterium]MBD3393998.1 5'/3'-nucleotidase SurE [Chitinivibrionales bacterium]